MEVIFKFTYKWYVYVMKREEILDELCLVISFFSENPELLNIG